MAYLCRMYGNLKFSLSFANTKCACFYIQNNFFICKEIEKIFCVKVPVILTMGIELLLTLLMCCNSRNVLISVLYIWGYKYLGTSKELGETWNDRFISFFFMLTFLTESSCEPLKVVAAAESSGNLLFGAYLQQNLEFILLAC